jgi:hypothetical protein
MFYVLESKDSLMDINRYYCLAISTFVDIGGGKRERLQVMLLGHTVIFLHDLQ